MAFWTKDGKLIVDSFGRPIDCATCPTCGAVPTFCCDLSGIVSATATIVINGVTIVETVAPFDTTTFFKRRECSETQHMTFDWSCIDSGASFIMYVALIDDILGEITWVSTIPGSVVGTCTPFFFRFRAYDSSGVNPDQVGTTVCGVPILGAGLNYVDFTLTVP